jgi:hypothetical protein
MGVRARHDLGRQGGFSSTRFRDRTKRLEPARVFPKSMLGRQDGPGVDGFSMLLKDNVAMTFDSRADRNGDLVTGLWTPPARGHGEHNWD